MYINVKLLNGFQRPFTYKVPSHWDHTKLLGAIVTVPLQKRKELALITELLQVLPESATFTIKEASTLEAFPCDPHYGAFISAVSTHYCIEPLVLYQRIKKFLSEQAETEHMLATREEPACLPNLTQEQQTAADALNAAIRSSLFQPFLLQGVTGSGKTEVYKKAIQEAYVHGKSTLFLIPEVSLAVQFAAIFKQTLPHVPCFGFHSATSSAEKRELWQRLLIQEPVLVVGVHLPLLLPLPKLGLIIIDEEHDPGFQEKKHPKINSKDMALLRAQISGIPIVLGSATPSIQSLYQVHHKKWQHLTLTRRFAGEFPRIQVVSLAEAKRREHFWITKELQNALAERLKRNEQSIIFINRRGYSFFVQCAACAFVFECPSCSVSLTLHEDATLRCHYCTYTMQQPERCTNCKPEKPTLLKKGIGTQQIAALLKKTFPTARIARADLDTTVNKKKWQQLLTDMHAGDIDILVGTQTITKGYHFPKVTLVGIVWADVNLNLPFYTATENTLQQLIQVAGRAGRQSPESLVVVQSMMNHRIYGFLDEKKYTQFYEYELPHRQELGYPPCVRFAEIEMRSTDETLLEKESIKMVALLVDFRIKTAQNLIILGPAKPPVHKIKNIFSRKIYLKASSFFTLQASYRLLQEQGSEIQLFFTPNPVQ